MMLPKPGFTIAMVLKPILCFGTISADTKSLLEKQTLFLSKATMPSFDTIWLGWQEPRVVFHAAPSLWRMLFIYSSIASTVVNFINNDSLSTRLTSLTSFTHEIPHSLLSGVALRVIPEGTPLRDGVRAAGLVLPWHRPRTPHEVLRG